MKKVVLALLGFVVSFLAVAQDDITTFGYVAKPGVNFRAKPSTSSRIVGKSSQGAVYRIINDNNKDWYLVAMEEGMDDVPAYISKQFVKPLVVDSNGVDVLASNFTFDDGDNYGSLHFEKDGKDQWGNEWCRFTYMIKNRQTVENGGSGVVASGSGRVIYLPEGVAQPEEFAGAPTLYDKAQRLFYYAGYLWDTEN